MDLDNRRPVDYSLRRRLLAVLDRATPQEIMARIERAGERRPVAQAGEQAGHGELEQRWIPDRLPRRVPTWGGITANQPTIHQAMPYMVAQ